MSLVSKSLADNTEAALSARCIELLFAHAKSALVIALMVAAIFVGLMWKIFPHSWLLLWLAAIAIISGLRLWHISAYYRAKPTFLEAKRWMIQYMVGCGVAALFWGGAGVVFMPSNEPLHQIFTLMLLVGLTAAAATTYSSVLLAYRIFLWITMTPVGLLMLFRADADYIVIGIMIFFYTIMMSQRAAVMVNSTVVDSIRYSLRVSELLELNESILNHTNAGAMAYKVSGECVLMNNAASGILGIPPSVEMKHNFRTNPSFQEYGVVEMADKVMASGVDKAVEFSIRTISGYEIWVAARLYRIVQGGQPILLMIFSEISPDRKPEYVPTQEIAHTIA